MTPHAPNNRILLISLFFVLTLIQSFFCISVSMAEPQQRYTSFIWSPDSRYLAYKSRFTIYFYDTVHQTFCGVDIGSTAVADDVEVNNITPSVTEGEEIHLPLQVKDLDGKLVNALYTIFGWEDPHCLLCLEKRSNRLYRISPQGLITEWQFDENHLIHLPEHRNAQALESAWIRAWHANPVKQDYTYDHFYECVFRRSFPDRIDLLSFGKVVGQSDLNIFYVVWNNLLWRVDLILGSLDSAFPLYFSGICCC